MLDRAFEIAADFVDAASPDHPMVESMVRANDAFTTSLTGETVKSDSWRSSAMAAFGIAQLSPNDPAVAAHLRTVVVSLQELSTDLGMSWTPPPALRKAAGLD